MNPHHLPTRGDAQTFQLDLPPLSQVGEAHASLQAFAAATVWLALGVAGIGLVGGVLLGG
jgi:hypothetical protein